MYSQKFFLFSFYYFQIRLPSSCLCYILMLSLYFRRPDFRGQIRGNILFRLNEHRRIRLTFQIQILINLYCNLYKNFLHCVQAQLLWLEFSKHSRNSSFLDFNLFTSCFTVGCATYRRVSVKKTGLASCRVSKSHGSEVRNGRDQRVFFFASFPSPVFSLLSKGKKSLWNPG